jgi:hypothetical protein
MSLYVGDCLVCRFGLNYTQTCTLDGHLHLFYSNQLLHSLQNTFTFKTLNCLKCFVKHIIKNPTCFSHNCLTIFRGPSFVLSVVTTSLLVCVVKLLIWYVAVCCLYVCACLMYLSVGCFDMFKNGVNCSIFHL